MSDEVQEPIKSPKKGSPLGIVIPLVLVILLVSGVGLYVSKSGVEEDVLGQQLANVSMQIAAMGDPDSGTSYSFVYDEVSAKGGDIVREARISAPVIRYQKVDGQGVILESVELTTSHIDLRYDVSDLENFSFETQKPIQVASMFDFSVGETRLSFLPKGMFKADVNIEQLTSDEGATEFIQRLLLTLPEDGIAIDRESVRVGVFTYANASPIELTLQSEPSADGLKSTRYYAFELNDAAIKMETFPLGLALNNVSFNGEVSDLKAGRISAEYAIEMSGLKFSGIETPLLPADLNLRMDYEGVPLRSMEKMQSHFVNAPLYLDVEEGFLQLGQTHLELKGVLENEGGTFLPLVDAHIEVSEFAPLYDLLVQQGNLVPQSETAQLVELFSQAITGLPLSELQNASFDVVRSDDSPFVIGNSTFEELVALWVANSFAQKKDSGLDKKEIEALFEDEAPQPQE